jgi:methionine salvage enolase-phosphatase E1
MGELTERDILQFTEFVQGVTNPAEAIKVAFRFLAEKQDYYFKQALLLADFYQQQSNQSEAKTLSQICQRSFEQVEREVNKLLGIHDPDLSQFILTYSDGLIWQRVYGEYIDFAKQGELLATMITLYLEQQNKKS